MFQAEPGSEEATRDYGHPREDFFLEAARGDDWVGVQAYTRTFIGPDGPRPIPDGTRDDTDRLGVLPAGARHALRNAWELTGGVPMIVTENGIATADDTRRIDYTRARWTGLARRDGRRHQRPRLPALERAGQLRVGIVPPDLRPDRLGQQTFRPHAEAEPGLARAESPRANELPAAAGEPAAAGARNG